MKYLYFYYNTVSELYNQHKMEQNDFSSVARALLSGVLSLLVIAAGLSKKGFTDFFLPLPFFLAWTVGFFMITPFAFLWIPMWIFLFQGVLGTSSTLPYLLKNIIMAQWPHSVHNLIFENIFIFFSNIVWTLWHYFVPPSEV